MHGGLLIRGIQSIHGFKTTTTTKSKTKRPNRLRLIDKNPGRQRPNETYRKSVINVQRH